MDAWITIRTFAQPADAYVFRNLLESGDIECRLLNENTIQVNPLISHAIGGVHLQVKKVDADDALAVLSDGKHLTVGEAVSALQTAGAERAEEINPGIEGTSDRHEPTMRCPHCGSIEVSEPQLSKGAYVATTLTLWFLGIPIPVFGRSCHCFDCGRDFRVANTARNVASAK